VRSLLDRKRHVMNVPVDMRRGLEGNRLCTDDAGHGATHDDLAARDHSRHLPLLADDDLSRLDIAFDLTVDLQDAPADDLQPLTDNLEVIADDDFSPLEGALMDGPLASAGRVVRGSRALGSDDGLRVNMKIPQSADEERTKRVCRAGADSSPLNVSSSSSFRCLRQRGSGLPEMAQAQSH
jgi:hypothetical protein